MVTLAIQLPEAQATELASLAARLGVTAEELAAAQILDLVARADPRYDQAARYVLEKNRELYRRLA